MKTVTSFALTAAAVLGGGQLFAAAPASAMHINCPVPQVRREITTHLPGGWWNTPIVSGLSDTDIQNIGGKPTLVCRYGPAGQIMRVAPIFGTCTAVPGGFECGTAPPAPHPVHSSGTVNIPQTYIVDLDTGHLNASGPGDLWFEAATATQFYLAPVNGARIHVGGHTAAGWAACSTASYSTGRVPIPAVLGRYVCVRTNSGRVGEVKVQGMMGGGIKTLVIDYRTWE